MHDVPSTFAKADIAVSNSSPLIFFSRIERLDLLGKVFTELMVPPAVWTEVMASENSLPGADELARTRWLRQKRLAPSSLLERLVEQLGSGEAEAIALARQLASATPLLIDDRKGRRIAREHGIPVIGSAGMLIVAKDLGLIPEVRPLLDSLRDAGLYLGQEARAEVLRIAGEAPSGTDRG